MTQSYEAGSLIAKHIAWLRPRVRSAHKGSADDEYPTIIARRRLLEHADEHLPHGLLDREVGEHIEPYLSQWRGWTRYTYHNHLNGFYAWGVEDGRLFFNPMASLARPDRGENVPNPCTDAELAVALTAPEPYGTAVRLAAYMGLRAGEIARADRSHVVGDMLRVRGKGGRTRTVPISPEVEHIIAAASGRLIGRRIREDSLSHHQQDVWRTIGLPGMRLHRARDWYATRLLEAGAHIAEVARLLGHASITTTAESYAKIYNERLTLMVTRLTPAAMLGASGMGRLVPGPSLTPAPCAA